MTALDALLGTISQDGVELELGSGLNFTGGVALVRNAATGKIDINVSGGGGSSFPLAADVSAATHKITSLGAPTAGSTNACTALYAETFANSAAATAAAAALAGALAADPTPGGAPAAVTKAAAAAGVAATFARSDHKHDVSTAAAGAVALSTTVAAEGSATTLARSDHTHSVTADFGTQVARSNAQIVAASSGLAPTVVADAGSFESCTTTSSTRRGFVHRQASADANGARIVLEKSRGTHSTPAAQSAEDHLGSIVARGYDGAAAYDAMIMRGVAEQAGGTGKRTRFELLLHDGTNFSVLQKGVSARIQTPSSALTTVMSIAIPADGLFSLGLRWSGKDPAGSNRAFKELSLVVRRIGSAVPTLVSTQIITALVRDDTTWGDDTQIAYVLNGGTNAIDLKVQGKTSVPIDWDVEASWREL